jgi:hypothetical protein
LAAHVQQTSDEQLMGVVSSDNLYRGDDMGYGLVITRDKIVGARKSELMENFEAYVGPGATATEALRNDARRLAETLVAARDLELNTGSIGQVLFKTPGVFSGGYVIMKTATRSVRVNMSVLYSNPRLLEISKVLADSLFATVGWRLCDGQTGDPLLVTRIQ